jgi:hypothetical protein
MFTAWFDAMRFAVDTQRVIALRMMKLAACDAKAAKEAQGMVTEKISAMMDAHTAATLAMIQGRTPEVVLARAMTPYRKRVRANRVRLSR